MDLKSEGFGEKPSSLTGVYSWGRLWCQNTLAAVAAFEKNGGEE